MPEQIFEKTQRGGSIQVDHHENIRDLLEDYGHEKVERALKEIKQKHGKQTPPVVTGPGGKYRRSHWLTVGERDSCGFIFGMGFGAGAGAIVSAFAAVALYQIGWLDSATAGGFGLGGLLGAGALLIVAFLAIWLD